MQRVDLHNALCMLVLVICVCSCGCAIGVAGGLRCILQRAIADALRVVLLHQHGHGHGSVGMLISTNRDLCRLCVCASERFGPAGIHRVVYSGYRCGAALQLHAGRWVRSHARCVRVCGNGTLCEPLGARRGWGTTGHAGSGFPGLARGCC